MKLAALGRVTVAVSTVVRKGGAGQPSRLDLVESTPDEGPQVGQPVWRTTMPSQASRQFIVDDLGNQVGVILEIGVYRELVEAAEELSAIRAYDDAKASGDEAVPFEEAVRDIEQGRL